MTIDVSVSVLHDPRKLDRVACLEEMSWALFPAQHRKVVDRVRPDDIDWHRFKVTLFREQWEWALSTDATHHLFLTDDLNLAPRFLDCLHAMIAAVPDKPIGLLSNHPRAIELDLAGHRWYRTNSWLVGPAYVLPRTMLTMFYAWWGSLPSGGAADQVPGTIEHWNDDSAINEWITRHGPGETWHPLPTIIEHRSDLPSTCGHGDRTSCERVSWRSHTHPHETPGVARGFEWRSSPRNRELMFERTDVAYWTLSRGDAPMMQVGG